VAGFIVSLIFVGKNVIGLHRLKQFEQVDMFSLKPNLRSYLICKVLFWPYFLIEKSPIERLSETFFCHYGNKDFVYPGNRGLKNFINDCLRGKQRYKHYILKTRHVKLDEDSPQYKDFIKHRSYGNRRQAVYAQILSAKHQKRRNHYLLFISLHSEITFDPSDQHEPTTRFDFDGCDRVSLSVLQERLLEISPTVSKEVIESLSEPDNVDRD